MNRNRPRPPRILEAWIFTDRPGQESLGCSAKKVRGRRENEHIPVFERQLHQWTAADDKRKRLGVACVNPRLWTSEESWFVGRLPDAKVAEKLGRSAGA